MTLLDKTEKQGHNVLKNFEKVVGLDNMQIYPYEKYLGQNILNRVELQPCQIYCYKIGGINISEIETDF